MANRRTPFDEMDSMMSRMFRSVWQDFESGVGMGYDGEGRMGRGDIHLTVEEADEGYVVLADLPGFERDEIDLRFEDGVLTIEAEHTVDESDEGMTHTRSRSAFERVRLPARDVVAEEIEASYHNGVLEIHVPVAEMMDEEGGHRIDID
jgi:HSP20 family protein